MVGGLVLFLEFFGSSPKLAHMRKHDVTIAACLIFYCGVYSIKLHLFWYCNIYGIIQIYLFITVISKDTYILISFYSVKQILYIWRNKNANKARWVQFKKIAVSFWSWLVKRQVSKQNFLI